MLILFKIGQDKVIALAVIHKNICLKVNVLGVIKVVIYVPGQVLQTVYLVFNKMKVQQTLFIKIKNAWLKLNFYQFVNNFM
jgi:hypothetical protein